VSVRSGARARVLLVDDDDLSRAATLGLLSRFEVEVVVAVDGQGALDRIDVDQDGRDPFDRVLLDLRMPVLNGFETARALRLREGVDPAAPLAFCIPIVALAATDDRATRDACGSAGIDDVLVKPVDREALDEVCERWLGLLPSATVAAAARTRPLADAADAIDPTLLSVLRREVDRLEAQLTRAIESLDGERRASEIGTAGHALAVVAAGLRAREVEEIATAVAREALAGGSDLALLTARAAGVLLAIGRLRDALDQPVISAAA